jgi:hypothetical protein
VAGVEGSGVLYTDSVSTGDGVIRIFDTTWGSSVPVQTTKPLTLMDHNDIQLRYSLFKQVVVETISQFVAVSGLRLNQRASAMRLLYLTFVS